MIRSVKLSLGFATDQKRTALNAVIRELRAAAYFYARSVWAKRGKLDAATQARYTGGSLSYRQKHDMLRLAIPSVVATKKAAKTLGKRARCPEFLNSLPLSENICKIERFHGAGFDYCARISGMTKGRPIIIPLKSHARLNHWLAQPGAKLLNSCVLGEDWIVVFVKLLDLESRSIGTDLGIDTGYRKLVATSDGNFHGTEMKAVCERIRRCKPGSKGKKRAQRARDQYVNKSVKSLPWQNLRSLTMEDLTGLKERTQDKARSSKSSRKRMAPWTYRQVRARVECLAQENRVRLALVDPRDTSRRCPSCGWVAKENRVAEVFRCVACHYTGDADTVGAVNILAKATGNWQEHRVPASMVAA